MSSDPPDDFVVLPTTRDFVAFLLPFVYMFAEVL